MLKGYSRISILLLSCLLLTGCSFSEIENSSNVELEQEFKEIHHFGDLKSDFQAIKDLPFDLTEVSANEQVVKAFFELTNLEALENWVNKKVNDDNFELVENETIYDKENNPLSYFSTLESDNSFIMVNYNSTEHDISKNLTVEMILRNN